MPVDFKDLYDKAAIVYRDVKSLHVDVMDGTFTHSRNWPFTEAHGEEWRKVTTGETPLPYWREVTYEVDVMMRNPEDSFAEWVNAGFHRVIVHIESTQNMDLILRDWKDVVEIGAAIDLETPHEALYPVLDAGVNFIQFMGISQIGFQGSPFEPSVIEKIKKLRKEMPDITISIDGGVSLENAPALLEAGVNRLVSGSAIFKTVNTAAEGNKNEKQMHGEEMTEIADYEQLAEKKVEMSAEMVIKKFKELGAPKTPISIIPPKK